VNLVNVTPPHGTEYRFDNATVTHLAGFHRLPDDWGINTSSGEIRKLNSVVGRLKYLGESNKCFRDRLLWVTSSLSAVYHLGGWFRPEADVDNL
jgi:hypothetical protein